jgi:histidine ammonia-lyase
VVEEVIREQRVVYGITTGFGALSEVVIPPGRIRELQNNLIRSHAAGVGEPLDEARRVRSCCCGRTSWPSATRASASGRHRAAARSA